MDANFLRIARQTCNPFTPESGTEHTATLLYSLARIARPRTVVEYGSGYTTFFLLAALAENQADFMEEADLLRRKTEALGDLGKLRIAPGDPAIAAWYTGGGKACGVDPGEYLAAPTPKLYSFEELDRNHPYTRSIRAAVEELKLSGILSYITGATFSRGIPQEALPVDLAWNDHRDYEEFFTTFWPVLNAQGGLMVFHNTAGQQDSWNAIDWIRKQREKTADMEILTLTEPHKLDQNSCTILRRTTDYQPAFLRRTQKRVLANTIRFMTGD